MTLTEHDLHLLVFCTDEERKARKRGKTPGIQGWEDPLIQNLCDELAEMSRTRQPLDDDDPQWKHETWISTREVSDMTGWGMRRIQRHSDKLGARDIGGRLAFPLSVIREHVEGAAG